MDYKLKWLEKSYFEKGSTMNHSSVGHRPRLSNAEVTASFKLQRLLQQSFQFRQARAAAGAGTQALAYLFDVFKLLVFDRPDDRLLADIETGTDDAADILLTFGRQAAEQA